MNYFKKPKSTNNKERGSILVPVVIVLLAVSGIALTLSADSLKSLVGVSDTNTADRALQAANGAAERTLSLTTAELNLLSGDPLGECGLVDGNSSSGECIIQFDPQDTDVITSQSSVEVTRFSETEAGFFVWPLEVNSVLELDMTGYPNTTIPICWQGNADLLLKAYRPNGTSEQLFVTCGASPCADGVTSYGASVQRDTTTGDVHCYDFSHTILDESEGLRIIPLGVAGTQHEIRIDSADLPEQGYQIHTVGTVVGADEIQIRKNVNVFKQDPHSPAIFDFALYGEGQIQ